MHIKTLFLAIILALIMNACGDEEPKKNNAVNRDTSIELDPKGDWDNDGIFNSDEQKLGTNPFEADSDWDGLTDLEEIKDLKEALDSDKDGILDALENNFSRSDKKNLDYLNKANTWQINYGRFYPFAIKNDGADETRIEVRIENLNQPAKVFLKKPKNNSLLLNGSSVDIELFDNGTNGDRIAADNIFTRAGLTSKLASFYSNKKINGITLYEIIVEKDGKTTSKVIPEVLGNAAFRLLTVNPETVEESKQISPKIKSASHIINIADPLYSSAIRKLLSRQNEKGLEDLTKFIFKHYDDEFDFLYFIPEAPVAGGAAGINKKLLNDTLGLGDRIFNISKRFGSENKLQNIIALNFNRNGPILHETAHRWAVTLPESLGFGEGAPGHWGFAGTNGQLGGFDPESLNKIDDCSFLVDSFGPFANGGDSIKYSPIELYFMGLLEKEAIKDIPVLKGAKIKASEKGMYEVSCNEFKSVSIEEIIDAVGERKPDQANSQKNFRAAFVLVSQRILSDTELAAFNQQAKLFGSKKGDGFLYSFEEASNGLATMKTEIQKSGRP